VSDFDKQIRGFTRHYRAQLRAVAREAVQDTVAKAQTPTGDGGRMRIDTGFLRASIQAGLHDMPAGPTQPEKGAKKNTYYKQVAGEPIAVTLLRWDPNLSAPLFVGWTAEYAQVREAKDGFLTKATEVWDQTVKRAVKSHG
jgi:hypothetical protein